MEFKGNGLVEGTLLVTAGALVGAGVALLFAPQSGKETRRDITRLARKTGHMAERTAHEVAGSISEVIDETGGRVADILGKGKELARDAGKEISGVIEEGQRSIERQKSRLSRLIA